MSDQPIKILIRFHLGTPFRLASAEEKQQTFDAFRDLMQKWKTSDIKLVGGFGSYGNGPDDYAHLAIFEVSNYAQVKAMNSDIFSSGLLYEKHSIEIGEPKSIFDAFWD